MYLHRFIETCVGLGLIGWALCGLQDKIVFETAAQNSLKIILENGARYSIYEGWFYLLHEIGLIGIAVYFLYGAFGPRTDKHSDRKGIFSKNQKGSETYVAPHFELHLTKNNKKNDHPFSADIQEAIDDVLHGREEAIILSYGDFCFIQMVEDALEHRTCENEFCVLQIDKLTSEVAQELFFGFMKKPHQLNPKYKWESLGI